MIKARNSHLDQLSETKVHALGQRFHRFDSETDGPTQKKDEF